MARNIYLNYTLRNITILIVVIIVVVAAAAVAIVWPCKGVHPTPNVAVALNNSSSVLIGYRPIGLSG